MAMMGAGDSVSRGFAELAGDYAYVFRVEADGALVQQWLADAFCPLIGRPAGSFDWAANWAEVVSPEDRDAVRRYRETLSAGQAGTVAFAVVAGDGRTVRLRETARVTQTAGEPDRICGAGVRVASSSVPEVDANLRRIVAHLPAVIWTTDADLRITFSGGQGLERLGLQPGELVDQPLMEFVKTLPPDHPTMERHRRVLRGETLRFIDVHHDWAYHVQLEPLRDDRGAIVGCFGVGLDVTEMMRAEQRLRRGQEALEARIAQRTADLAEANRELAEEVRERRRAETALRETEQRLRSIIDSTKAVVYIKGREGRYLLVNRRFLEIFNLREEQVLGHVDAELFPPAIARAFRRNDERVLAEGVPLELDELVAQGDGPHTYISLKFPIADVKGRVYGICGVSTDITERKRMESALRESEQYNRMLFEQSPIGLALCRLDGRMVDVNGAFARIIGRTPEQARELTYWDLTPTEYVDDERRILEALRRTGRYGPYEKEYFHSDGRRVPVRLSGMILDRGGERYIWSSVEDITEPRRAEEAIRASEKKYRNIFETSRDGIAITTLEGVVEDANPAFLAMLGYRLDELRGRHFRELTPERWYDMEDVIIAQEVMARGYSEEYEKEYIHRDGTVFPAQVRVWLTHDDEGRPVGMLGAVRDITERRRAEEIARERHAELAHVSRLSIMGEMAAGFAHELNQPLAAVTNYAHGCLRRIETGADTVEEISAALRQITQQAGRASEIIRRVRRFLKKGDQRRADVDLNQVVRDAVDLLARDLERHRVSVDLQLSAEPLPVRVDEILIQQVVVNLVLNGMEAMADIAAAARRLTLESSADPLAGARLCVTDAGPGLSEDAHLRVFEPFYTTKERGMGMGLSISRTIIERHGGRMWVETTGGAGTRFGLVLPTI